jgi:protein required for attachment to host cells
MTENNATWYVAADGKQVRILRRDGHGLKPLQQFDATGHGDPDHDADLSVSHIHAPSVDPHVQAKEHFAHHVAKHLNEAVAQGGVHHIHLAAPAHVLHDIVAALSKQAEQAVQSKISKDLIHNTDAELFEHFEKA